MTRRNIFIGVIAALVIVAVVSYFVISKDPSTLTPSPLTITTTSGNYGLFIDSEDNEYFSTKDANVRNIIEAYLTQQKEYPYELTDAQNYGKSLVYYYTKDVFIAAELGDWRDRNSTQGFTMHDMKTGEWISDCIIYSQAGFYKSDNLLLSVSYTSRVPFPKNGVCLYERGAENFRFIELSSKLTEAETFFNDPLGQNLKAIIKNVDADDRTFIVEVYDTEKKDAEGNYAYKRDLEVSY